MRVRLRIVLIGLLVGLAAEGGGLRAQPNALSVEGVTITVEDLDRAVPFYRDALSFAPVDTTTWTGSRCQ